MATITSTYHSKPYPAIDLAAPQNSMRGRSVLTAGATGGIGLATAHAFLKASPSNIIILGRRESALTTAVAELNAARPMSSPTKIIGKQCDISDVAPVDYLWKGLRTEHIEVDVLILNAASISATSTYTRLQDMITFLDMNVSASLRMADGFLEQGPKTGKVIINTSSMAAHGSMGCTIGVVAYGASKAGGAAAFQVAADCILATECFVLNVHPGAILTSSAREGGWDENSVPWDDGEFCHVPFLRMFRCSSPRTCLMNAAALPGFFFVWASTPQARDAALHGRLVWANWDVNELVAMKPKFEADPGYLGIGLQGVPSLNVKAHFAKMAEMTENYKP